ncbi:hypothetical protein ACIBJF_43490 [Streptomyces sp. NPDC050743]|uniref:hypothetical protein n=1 Tax=Streptomyces sp. NPDC050743 TaxID=3365634 RepID=UPI0037B0F1F9
MSLTTADGKSEWVIARLIVRRVRNLAKPAVVGEQGELFPVWRYFRLNSPALSGTGRWSLSAVKKLLDSAPETDQCDATAAQHVSKKRSPDSGNRPT